MPDPDFARDPSFPAQVGSEAHIVLKCELLSGILSVNRRPADQRGSGERITEIEFHRVRANQGNPQHGIQGGGEEPIAIDLALPCGNADAPIDREKPARVEQIALVIDSHSVLHFNRAEPENGDLSFRKKIVYSKTQRVGDISDLYEVPGPDRGIGGICFRRLRRNTAKSVIES